MHGLGRLLAGPWLLTRFPLKKTPTVTRRLTKAEAARLGISHKAKRRVDASLKRVTSKTKLYTDRDIAEAKLGRSKEAYTAFRISKPDKSGAITYRNVKQSEHFRLAKRVGNRHCQIIGFGNIVKKARFGGSQIEGLEGGDNQTSIVSYGFDGNELRTLLDRMYSSHGYLGFSASNLPKRVDVVVYRSSKVAF